MTEPIGTPSSAVRDVSRETHMTLVEVEPPAAAALFGDRIDLARRFVQALTEHGETRGLIGPLEAPRLWSRHILNSVVISAVFSGRVGDVGSGAGLPGIVLAIARPDVDWVLIEPMERRVAWLTEQTESLGLTNVEILRARAEDWPHGPSLDFVTARAVSALRTLIPITAPLVKDGGELILLKGAGVAGEIDAAQKAIRKYKLSDVRVETFGEGIVSEPTRVLRASVRADYAR